MLSTPTSLIIIIMAREIAFRSVPQIVDVIMGSRCLSNATKMFFFGKIRKMPY